jgi:hypothetical protein
MDDTLTAARDAHAAGRFDEALGLLVAVFEAARDDPLRFAKIEFLLMFQWKLLVQDHVPARTALARLRDERARRLLEGAGDPGRIEAGRHGVFSVIVRMNDILEDSAATYTLFVRMLEVMPQRAGKEVYLALPAIVAAGDFALAEGYLRDPLAHLDELNQLAQTLPLFPEGRAAPRLAAELANHIQDVRHYCAVLEGTGRAAQAHALREAALEGIAAADMRAWGRRELAEPGAINRKLAAGNEAHYQATKS